MLSPVIGFAIIGFVLVNADVHAKVGGLIWLAIGAVILIGLRLRDGPPSFTSRPRPSQCRWSRGIT